MNYRTSITFEESLALIRIGHAT